MSDPAEDRSAALTQQTEGFVPDPRRAADDFGSDKHHSSDEMLGSMYGSSKPDAITRQADVKNPRKKSRWRESMFVDYSGNVQQGFLKKLKKN